MIIRTTIDPVSQHEVLDPESHTCIRDVDGT
jgi:hypothetical protein